MDLIENQVDRMEYHLICLEIIHVSDREQFNEIKMTSFLQLFSFLIPSPFDFLFEVLRDKKKTSS